MADDAGTRFVDVNGEGHVDFVKIDGGTTGNAWINSPGDAATWVEDTSGRFSVPSQDMEATLIDLDGDGATDVIDRSATALPIVYRSQSSLPDLADQIDNGRGGTIQLSYVAGPAQRDPSLESAAVSHALAPLQDQDPTNDGDGEPPGPDPTDPSILNVVRWTTIPLLSSITITGPNRAAAVTSYRYGHPRVCLHHRSGLGFRLVERTQPDGSATERFYYKKHGRAGKLSEATLWDTASAPWKPLHHTKQVWDLVDPAAVPGAWAGDANSEPVHIGRLWTRSTRTEYGTIVGDSTGATRTLTFSYDDNTYGYGFVDLITDVRPSSEVHTILTPENADLTNWIIGLTKVREEHQELPSESIPLSRSTCAVDVRVRSQDQYEYRRSRSELRGGSRRWIGPAVSGRMRHRTMKNGCSPCDRG